MKRENCSNAHTIHMDMNRRTALSPTAYGTWERVPLLMRARLGSTVGVGDDVGVSMSDKAPHMTHVIAMMRENMLSVLLDEDDIRASG